MTRKPVLSAILPLLTMGAFLLPIAIVLFLGLGRLLGAMGDAAGSQVLGYLGLAGGLVWLLDLVWLVLVLAIQAIGDQRDRNEE
jgi:hypothetical protein